MINIMIKTPYLSAICLFIYVCFFLPHYLLEYQYICLSILVCVSVVCLSQSIPVIVCLTISHIFRISWYSSIILFCGIIWVMRGRRREKDVFIYPSIFRSIHIYLSIYLTICLSMISTKAALWYIHSFDIL